MSKRDSDHSSLRAKRDTSGTGDRRRSAASGDGETGGGEGRLSCDSGGRSPQSAHGKKVAFSEPATDKDTDRRSSQALPVLESQTSQGEEGSPKNQKKIISTWKMACGMTKDKTKDLLKRWRTLPDSEAPVERPPLQELKQTNASDGGWSVHVWGDDSLEESDSSVPGVATWVKRFPADDEPSDADKTAQKSNLLTEVQKEKLTHFFAHVFDMDRDDVIALQDIEGFTEEENRIVRLKTQNDLLDELLNYRETFEKIQAAGFERKSQSIEDVRAWLLREPKGSRPGKVDRKRLRHFAEWSTNSGEYLILQQVQQGLVETFIYPLIQGAGSSEVSENQVPKDLDRLFLSVESWLNIWGELLRKTRNFHDLPLWLQFLPKTIFSAINKTGSGRISKDELGAFYSSVIGFPSQKLPDLLTDTYDAMTAMGDYKLTYECYRLCFANFLFGRYPNGPGQFMFGAAQRVPPPAFPIDYSAMNTPPEDIEPFNGSLKSNRSSIIV